MNKRAVAIVLGSLIVTTTLGGCVSVFGKDALDYPLVAPLTEKEVVDYYKKALSFDTIATRNLNVQEVKYESKSVDEETEKKIVALMKRVETALNGMDYSYNAELDKILKESTFHYMKAYLNDKKLDGGKVLSVKEALGYYFVDVEYDVLPRSIGNILPPSTLLGIHGAFSKDYQGNDNIDTIYIGKAVANLNRHYQSNKINKSIVFDGNTGSLSMVGNTLPPVDFTASTVSDSLIKGTTEVAVAPVAQSKADRATKIDTKEVNTIAGASMTQSSYMPKLSMVYQAPAPDGQIGGIGIYPCGDGGLKRFGYSRARISGKTTLRYVFKSNVNNPSEILGVNVYPTFSELVSGINTDTEKVVVPDFLMDEFDKLIDRSDRAIVNGDLPALMSGEIYSDAGMGILVGYQGLYSNVSRNMSKVRRVIARDTEKGAYLLEVDTVRQEGSKDANTFATYRDKNYVVVEQVANKFVITDTITMNRQMTKEHPLNPDSSVTKRLVALNLAGEVPENSKKDIEELLKDFYTASSARVLNGPKDAKIGKEKVKVERGMYDCFNNDPDMLSTDRKEYLNGTVRELLVKHGVKVDAKYEGVITEWIGGANNQAEFITEEIITYDKKNTGRYMQTYYLVSKMGDKWVIDDMKIIESEDKSGGELEQIVKRLSKN